MNKSFWMPILLPLLDRDEEMKKFGEAIYYPKDRHEVVFWFEGGLKISGTNETLSINLKEPDLMVLMTNIAPFRILRVPFNRLVGFELIVKKSKKEEVTQFFRN